MPRLGDDDGDEYREQAEELLEEGEKHAKRLFAGFVDFAFSGNILEIAFGLILASAFTALTTSFVTDIILPPLSVILPLNRNLDEKFAVLQKGPNFGELDGYTTLAIAQEDGAVVLAYGLFLNKCFNFLGMGLSLYGLAVIYEYLSHDAIIKHTVKCRYCRKQINIKSQRCVNCTSWLDGREETNRLQRENVARQ
ncbi:large-conductance mechanosensitive channel [Truncatella angustata]|uniref:Large-conductance mechanosensitive channel n=1 Tax=Truncatella angustata TaxID=152316 RepID=A0A9P8UWW5_9PEZI|nr:large-conductance mechanosensitive channel [Truncatella angustata]KAH6659678.1 large-conductance mechanosensitive channel [Truncatella angustata]